MKIPETTVTAAGITVAAMFITGVMTYYSAEAVGEHDGSDKAHSAYLLAVQALESKLDLVVQKQELDQNSNVEAHDRSDRAQDRMMDALIRIDEKVSQ